MNKISWRHHYIPRFYLNGFTSAKGTFKIFDVKKGTFVRNGKDFSPEAYFFERNGNTLSSREIQTDFLEKSYAKKDGRIAEIFQRINSSSPESKFNLTDDDIALLQHFVGIMYWRIPANFEEVKAIVSQKSLKELGLIIQNTKTNKPLQNSDLEGKLKSDPNFFKAMKSHFPDISFPELFNCHTPLHILPFAPGLPSICSDNPIVCRYPETFRVYTDDFIFPINSTTLFVRAGQRKEFYTSAKIYVDMIIFKQAKMYVSCTDEKYIDGLDKLYNKHFNNLSQVRNYLFDLMFGN